MEGRKQDFLPGRKEIKFIQFVRQSHNLCQSVDIDFFYWVSSTLI